MGKYSSDSSVESNSRRKKNKHRSSSASSSDSRYSRQKKSKKSKKSRRSRSRDRSKQSKRDRSLSRSRRRYRSRSRSRSRRDKRSKSRDSYESRRRKSRSRSRKDDREQDLMQKLNNAVVEVMNENAKRREEASFGDKNSVREMLIDEINSPNFVPKTFNSSEKIEKKKEPKPIEKPEPFRKELPKEEPGCLLHPNLLLDDHEEKLNRWVKKIYQIRQRSIHGDYLVIN